MKWEVMGIAPDQITAEIWCDILQQEGITAMIEPGDAISFMGVSSFPCRVMVPENMGEGAREALGGNIEQAE